MINFKDWLKETVGTYAIYDPKVKPKDFNWWGSPGSAGTVVKKGPIKNGKGKKRIKH